MNAEKRREIFRRFHEDNPEPKTELSYSTPFELLIAVILSAQATDAAAARIVSEHLQDCGYALLCNGAVLLEGDGLLVPEQPAAA